MIDIFDYWIITQGDGRRELLKRLGFEDVVVAQVGATFVALMHDKKIGSLRAATHAVGRISTDLLAGLLSAKGCLSWCNSLVQLARFARVPAMQQALALTCWTPLYTYM